MTKKPKLGTRVFSTGAVVVLAVVGCVLVYLRLAQNPWTRNGQVKANIIMLAPRVTGIVVDVAVSDNQFVSNGDVLFGIDPSDYELAVSSARIQLDEARQEVESLEAAIATAAAGVREAEASLATARANIDSARAQVEAAEGQVAATEAAVSSAQAAITKDQAALEQALRDRERAQKLAEDGAGSTSSAESRAARVQEAQATLEGTRAKLKEAQANRARSSAGLRQAQAGLVSSRAMLGETEARLASAQAALTQARSNLGAPGEQNTRIRTAKDKVSRAELDLDRVTVRAPTDGYVTNLNVDVGDYAHSGTPMLAFVDSASFRVEGFFRETQLRRIRLGDRAVITLMSHRDTPIEGVVESIGWAINPPNIATTEGPSGLVPQVQPSFDWIRLAQRVPVRVRIESIPQGVHLVSGTTASVVIRPED